MLLHSDRPPCPLTLADVQSYIRSKGADEIIGTQHTGTNTLIAEVWYFVHGCAHMAAVRHNGRLEVGDVVYELSDELWAIHLLFERIPMVSPRAHVRKQTWIEYAATYWYKTIKAAKGVVA